MSHLFVFFLAEQTTGKQKRKITINVTCRPNFKEYYYWTITLCRYIGLLPDKSVLVVKLLVMEDAASYKLHVQLECFPYEVQRGLLFLCLLEDKVELIQLTDLLSSPEIIDELLQLPRVHASQSSIWLEKDVKLALLAQFKWSEKVKAAGVLAHYFEGKSLASQNRADLWFLAGNKEKASSAYLQAMYFYKNEKLYPAAIYNCEKILQIGTCSEEAEVILLKELIDYYACLDSLHEVIQARTKLLGKSVFKEQKVEYAALLRALAVDYGRQGSWSYYKNLREEAARAFRTLKMWDESTIEYIGLCNRCIDELNISKGLAYAEEALNDAIQSGQIELISKGKAIQAYLWAMDGHYEKACPQAEEALQLALRNNLLEAAGYAYRKLAGTYEYASDFQQARVIYQEALHFCEKEKMDVQTQMCYSCLSWILFRLGKWKNAIDVCRFLINDPKVNNPSKSTAHCILAIAMALRGDIRRAEKHTRDGIFLAQQERFLVMYHLLHLPMAKINELKGNVQGAREWYSKIIDEWHHTKEKHDVLISLMDACIFFVEQQDKQLLKKSIEIIALISKETGNPEAVGCMAFGMAMDAHLRQALPAAMDCYMEALKYFEPLAIPYQQLLVEGQMGKCLIEKGETARGKKLLQDVLVKAKGMGLAPMVAKVSVIVNQTTLYNKLHSEILTERQQEVLLQLGKGLSNKEIAVRLNLSTRTVDMHMRNLFDRLGCKKRWEAVEMGKALDLL